MEENNIFGQLDGQIEFNTYSDIKYLIEKRDNALERFNRTLRKNEYDVAELHKQLDNVLRINSQLKLMEDAFRVFDFAKYNLQWTKD